MFRVPNIQMEQIPMISADSKTYFATGKIKRSHLLEKINLKLYETLILPIQDFHRKKTYGVIR